MDDFDLLEATIDPSDVKSLRRRQELEIEIELEQIKMKSKLLWKIALTDENPMRIDEWVRKRHFAPLFVKSSN